jgi:hypothetical protein
VRNLKLSSATVFLLILSLSVSDTLADPEIGGGIKINRINNYYKDYIPTWVEAGVPLTFTFWVNNGSGFPIDIMRGFFEVYSPDGAVWQPIDGDWVDYVDWNQYFQGGGNYGEYSADGFGADTALFIAVKFEASGFPNMFTSDSWFITTQVDQSQVGKQICIDSVRQAGISTWSWTYELGNFAPSWIGPKCFTIEADCCQGVRGDVNGDGNDSNTLDLNYMVERVFRGGPFPPCPMEADLNGDGTSATITDLTYLIDYIFRGGPAGVNCP